MCPIFTLRRLVHLRRLVRPDNLSVSSVKTASFAILLGHSKTENNNVYLTEGFLCLVIVFLRFIVLTFFCFLCLTSLVSQLTGSYTEVEPEIKKDTLFKSIASDLYLPAHQI